MLNMSPTLTKHLSDTQANGIADVGSEDGLVLFAGVLILAACVAAIAVAAAEPVEEPAGRDLLIITITESATEAVTEEA